ncbi:MAG: dienelactone hydrolase family protein, partial [Saprospiraceae bacterium]|nr:dienelactone hydrolase family protein [Saprospiraceae bacterium]
LTGLSMGAIATFKYLGSYGSKAKVAAAVPICGSAQVGRADRIGRTPIWIFHGQADHIIPVSQSHEMAEALRRLEGKRHARLTIFPGVGHHSWDMVYDGTGRGQEDPTYDIFDQDIYSWMLQYHRD